MNMGVLFLLCMQTNPIIGPQPFWKEIMWGSLQERLKEVDRRKWTKVSFKKGKKIEIIGHIQGAGKTWDSLALQKNYPPPQFFIVIVNGGKDPHCGCTGLL